MTQEKPVRNEEMFTKVGWSPFNGWLLTGWPITTIVGGRVVFDKGEILPNAHGQPLHYVEPTPLPAVD
jgi:dihydroorotase